MGTVPGIGSYAASGVIEAVHEGTSTVVTVAAFMPIATLAKGALTMARKERYSSNRWQWVILKKSFRVKPALRLGQNEGLS